MARKIILKARYILPISSPPISDGVIIINGNIIEDVSPSPYSISENCRGRIHPTRGRHKCRPYTFEIPSNNIIDLGNVVLMPGFVNCHTHLELSMLKGMLKYNGNFAQWLEALVEAKLGWNEKEYVTSTKQGIAELINTGTTTVADITNTGYSVEPILNSGLRGIVYKEIIGFDPEKSETIFKENVGFIKSLNCRGRIHPTRLGLDKSSPYNIEIPYDKLDCQSQKGNSHTVTEPLLRLGISPHAPYSVSGKLLEKIAKYSSKNGMPLTIHISESEEEVQFLKEGSSPLKIFMRKRGALPSSWQPVGTTPVSYLYGMNLLSPKTLGVHLNYLTDDDIKILKNVHMPIVHCPKSMRFFNRHPYDTPPSSSTLPYKSIMDYPIEWFNTAIGTDSLASNDSLNMLDEMRLLKETLNVPADTLLRMATTNGAKSLGLDDKIGTLEPGKCADIIALRKVSDSTSFPTIEELSESLLRDEWKVSFVLVDGKILKQAHSVR